MMEYRSDRKYGTIFIPILDSKMGLYSRPKRPVSFDIVPLLPEI